jgi:dipeptidyl aminopeptidase/acylaminoacyl peptidase
VGTRGWRASIFLLWLPLVWAGPTLDRALDSLSEVRHFQEIAVSPDGGMAAWIETGASGIYVKDLRDHGAQVRHIAESAESEQGLAWSRDGRLAFLATGDSPGQLQLYIAEVSPRSKTRRVTNVQGHLADPQWAPDGHSIAFLWIEGVTRAPGPTDATAPDTGVGASEIHQQRLAIVNPAKGAVRAISPAEMYVYEFDWAPDSQDLAYLAAPGSGNDNWYIAQIYALDSLSGAVREVLKPAMQVANVRWSPDGKTIAFIGGLMSDENSAGGDIYAVPAEGGQPRDLTRNRKSSPNWFRWLPTSKELLLTEGVSGDMAVSNLDLASEKVETLWRGPEHILFSGDAAMSAVIRSSWARPPEVWTGSPGHWRQLTHWNDNVQPWWGDAKSVQWKSDDFRVQGWLLFPKPYDPAKHYPMIVLAHGGPASETRPAWPSAWLPLELLSAEGYFLFLPNPRGSYGQGEDFTRANVRDLGHGDLRDILAGVDAVVKDYPVDERRIGIAGWSYGGYIAMWAVTQTHRFWAVFAGAGIANWQSYYGENAIDQWMIPYFGASVYDDPEVYAKSSPINFIKNVTAPALIAVGERDGECPPAQSREYWHALKTLGVKTELVIYPGEGHGFHDPEHSRDLLERVVEWFRAQ